MSILHSIGNLIWSMAAGLNAGLATHWFCAGETWVASVHVGIGSMALVFVLADNIGRRRQNQSAQGT